MLERFTATFRMTDGVPGDLPPGAALSVATLADRFGGCTFERGLYRVHSRASAAAASTLVANAFPDLGDRLSCFAFDWLGRQFAVDRSRGAPDDPEIMMLEPGTGEALEIPVSFTRFHDEELVDYTDEALAVGFFSQWMSSGDGSAIAFEQCVGYRTPLFLGGDDEVANLELADIDVYWTIMGQLRRRALQLPAGTPVAHVRMEDG